MTYLPEEPPTYPHVLIGEILDAIRRHDQGAPRKHVAILGAGMSGLVAAYELARLGHTVEVLEASGRTGGRVWTHTFADGTYNELGAMRVPPSHDYTLHYIDEMGLTPRLIPFINSTPAGFWDLHGVVVRNRAEEVQGRIYPRFALSDAFRATPSGGAILGQLIHDVLRALTPDEIDALFAGRVTTDYLHHLENLSLGDFLAQRAGTDAREVAGVFTSLEVWYDKAITMFLRDEIVGTGADLVTLEGGMSQLPGRLAERLEGCVALHREVVKITLAGGDRVDVRVRHAEDGTIEDRVFDFVLCTIPFSVLRRVELEGLSYGKRRAIRNLSYANATKVLLDCDRRFWQDDHGIFGGSSISDHLQRQTYFPMDGLQAERARGVEPRFRGLHTAEASPWRAVAGARDGGPGALTGAYCWGQDARRLGALDEAERRRVVTRNVERFLPELGDHVVDSASMSWERNPWTAGAFAFFRPGDVELYFEDAIRPEGRLFFAGEHLSTDPAWIQGALIASLRAVDEIVAIREGSVGREEGELVGTARFELATT